MYEFIEYVLWELKQSFLLVLLAGLAAVAVLAVTYGLHKKKYQGERKYPWGKALLYLMLVGYLAIVLYATVLRGTVGIRQVNLHLFRAWREALNNYSAKKLANVLLNVAMFVPLGFLLPLLWKKFRKWYLAIPAGFCFSLAIELVQLAACSGVFDVDDLFANTLGTVIGYLLVMTVLRIFAEKRLKSGLTYGCLCLAVILSICSIFVLYRAQEYGNLPNAPAYTVDTSGTEWTLDCDLPASSGEAAVYRTQSRTMQDCDVFAEEFREIIDTEYNTISYYEEAAYYMDNGTDGGAHFLHVNYLDTGYSYTAIYDIDPTWADADRETVEAALEKFPLLLPEYAEFSIDGDGWYSFSVEQYVDGAVMVDGELRCRYASDGLIREIQNSLLSYAYYDTVAIISAEEAYSRLCAGKFGNAMLFEYHMPDAVSVFSCSLEYEIDTKGFYQPVYRFEVASPDGDYQDSIMIPAMN